jgi:hypothetical protein
VLSRQYDERARHLAGALLQPAAPAAGGKGESRELPCGEQVRSVNSVSIPGGSGYGTPATAEPNGEVPCSARS